MSTDRDMYMEYFEMILALDSKERVALEGSLLVSDDSALMLPVTVAIEEEAVP